MEISESVAIVTGGASGLGAATATKLAKEGASVVLLDLNDEKGNALAAELGEKVVFCKTDVTNPSDVEAAIARAKDFGTLRIAVSCAGVGWAARTLNRDGQAHSLDLFQKVININLIGTFNILRLSAEAMAKNEKSECGERGVIINTASVAAYEGQIGQIAYAASKAGVVGMTVPAARDLSRAGIRVNTIAPGIFDTPMLAALPDEARAALGQSVVFPKRLGQTAEYAALAAHIVQNCYLNGETIRLDGAIRMAPK